LATTHLQKPSLSTKTGNNEWSTDKVRLKFYQEGAKATIATNAAATGALAVVLAEKGIRAS
jgi:hypothetical protein